MVRYGARFIYSSKLCISLFCGRERLFSCFPALWSGMVCLCSATCYTCKAVQSDSLFGGTKLSRLLSKRLHLELSLASSSAAGFIRRVFFTAVTLLNTNLSPLVYTTLFMSAKPTTSVAELLCDVPFMPVVLSPMSVTKQNPYS